MLNIFVGLMRLMRSIQTLSEFIKWLLPIIDKHAPVKKRTVRTVKAPWIDEELKNYMVGWGKRCG